MTLFLFQLSTILFKKKQGNDHLAKHHAPEYTLCLQEMQAFIFFNNERGESMGLDKIWFQMSGELTVVLKPKEPEKINKQLQQELYACQYLFDDNEVKKSRHRVFNFKLSKLRPNKINKSSPN